MSLKNRPSEEPLPYLRNTLYVILLVKWPLTERQKFKANVNLISQEDFIFHFCYGHILSVLDACLKLYRTFHN